MFFVGVPSGIDITACLFYRFSHIHMTMEAWMMKLYPWSKFFPLLPVLVAGRESACCDEGSF